MLDALDLEPGAVGYSLLLRLSQRLFQADKIRQQEDDGDERQQDFRDGNKLCWYRLRGDVTISEERKIQRADINELEDSFELRRRLQRNAETARIHRV